jgi:integrase
MKRQSFQQGSVVRRERKRGPDVWIFYHRENGKQVPHRIGTVEKYPTKAAAEKAASKIRKDINGQREHVWMRDLLKKYEEDDLQSGRHNTAAAYKSHMKRIKERWGDTRLDVMAKDMMGIEQWLNSLQTLPTKKGKRPVRLLAKKSRFNLKALLHRLFERAIFWGLLEMQRNPIGLVTVKGKSGRTRPLVIVPMEAYDKMLKDPELAPHGRMMVILAMALGLRVSEILGLRPSEDFRYETQTLTVQRSVDGKYEDETKTPGSTKEIPIDWELAEEIKAYLERTDSNGKRLESPGGWMFGNPVTERPYWRDSLLGDHIEPAAKRAGREGIGWHSFRHTYRTNLDELGEPIQVQQKMMRHSDIKTTMSYGDQKVDKQRRNANNKMFEMLKRSA